MTNKKFQFFFFNFATAPERLIEFNLVTVEFILQEYCCRNLKIDINKL